MTSSISPPPNLHNHIVAIAQEEGIVDYKIEYEAGSKHGDGFMGAILAISVKGTALSGNKTPKHLSLICKLMPENKARQEIFSAAVIFEREVHFYKNILPILENIQKQYNLTRETGFFAYPHCYVAVANAQTNEYVLIMKDLRDSGYTLWNKFEPITYEKVYLLMEQLGRVHGLSFVLRDKFPDLFIQIQDMNDLMKPLISTSTMKTMMESSYDKAIEILDKPEHKEVIVQVKKTWIEMLGECVDGSLAEPYAVLGHGDCWNNNMMFSNDKICLLDWQICRYVSPVLDLAYFFFSSTNKELRDHNFERLIRTYHESMNQILSDCKCSSKAFMSFDNLQDQLRKFGKYGVVMAPVLLQVIVADPKNITNLDDVSEAVGKDESQLKNSFAKFDEESSAKYRKRLGDVIDDAKRMKWI